MDNKLSIEPKVHSESNGMKIQTQDKTFKEQSKALTSPKISNEPLLSKVPMDHKLLLEPSVTNVTPEPRKTKALIATNSPTETSSTTSKEQNAKENNVSQESKSTMKVKISQDVNVSKSKMVSPLIPNDPWEYYEHPNNEEKSSDDLNKEASLKAGSKNKAEEVVQHKIKAEAKKNAEEEARIKAEAEAKKKAVDEHRVRAAT